MTDGDGRDERGQFAAGNTHSLKSGGGFGLESQIYSGKISERLMSAAHKIVVSLENGNARALHHWVTGLTGAVCEGLATTFSDALEASKPESVYRADRSLHSWLALYARLTEWEAEHPDGNGGPADYEKILEAKQHGDKSAD